MFIFKRVPHLQEWIARHKKENTALGFVPTMGALHEGHISLVQQSKSQSDLTLVSIFVNPLQFNDPEDLKKYPRPIESDIEKTWKAGTDVLFLPEVNDIYPANDALKLNFDPGVMGEVLEGKFRPGHFKGMAEVVYRLLKIVMPDKIFLGQKDFQQVAVIRKLIVDTNLPVEVIVCPTLREANGLAMSSRNMRLSELAKEEAGLIYKTLLEGKSLLEKGMSSQSISEWAMQIFRQQNWDPEYFEVVDGFTLSSVNHFDAADYIVACCAVKVEGVRLIDNVIYKKS
ncbi:MAG TPA: pantoate--beta-alanine ligase [Saprospiraceae bacterium]|nr:pantoate--beta-alanine ligase [Saprospiraceae bacterium]